MYDPNEDKRNYFYQGNGYEYNQNNEYPYMYPSEMKQTTEQTKIPEKERKIGRKKISMEYIKSKNKRNVTFSKRKKGIMKKAYELTRLTRSEILLMVTNESGHVYTFATPRFKPIIAKHENLIQQCLSSPIIPAYSSFDDNENENEYEAYNQLKDIGKYNLEEYQNDDGYNMEYEDQNKDFNNEGYGYDMYKENDGYFNLNPNCRKPHN